MRLWPLLLLLAACSTPPQPAKRLPDLSDIIAGAMKGRAGAVVVMDGRGQILAQYNPQTAQQRAFPVGSAIKPFIARAIQNRRRTYHCRGEYLTGSLRLLCTHSRQKEPLDLARALALSCNGYFASLKKEEIDLEAAQALLIKHGFGRSSSGVGRALFNFHTDEERANFLIGETDRVTMTPAAFTKAMLSLATNGAGSRLDLPEEIVTGLRDTLRYGTGANSRWSRPLSKAVVLAKTGSPTIPKDTLTHGWFTALICRELEIDFAITVFLDSGRGHEAAEIAAEIVDNFLESTSKPKDGLDVALFSPLEPREILLRSPSMRLRDASGRLLSHTTQLRLSVAGSKISIQSKSEEFKLERVLVEADDGISVRAEGALARSYRGWLSISLGKRPQTLLVLERVDLESYVAGVVTAEIPEETQVEALKAQAVVARSFAVSAFSAKRHAYGLCSSTHCQRYEGGSSPQAAAASRQTAGEYLLDEENRPAQTLFHSCCGGKRLTAERVWSGQAISPAPCLYCAGHNFWQREFSKQEVMAAVGGYSPRALRLIQQDGACLRLEVIGDSGQRQLSCGKILESLGVDSPPSSLRVDGERVALSGRGRGHGVGLCQHAAHFLAAEGRDYKQILSEFYPRLRLSRYEPGTAQTVYDKDGVSVNYAAPNTSEEAREVAEIALEAAKELEKRGISGFQFLLHPDSASFRRATGLPGDSAAASVRDRIHLQPVRLLKERGVLRQAIRHEMMHIAIERVGGVSTARWFHEGYAVVFAGEAFRPDKPMSLQELECALLKATALEQRRQLYNTAATIVSQLLSREGEQKVWRDLANGRFRSSGCR